MSVSSAISALLSRLRESSIQETIAFLGINQQIEELQSNLQNLQSYTVDADQGINKDERIRGWLAKISDIYYEAEDVLDDYALKVASMRRRGGLKDVVKRYFCSFREMEAGNKVAIATLNKRIKELVDLLRLNDRVVSTDAEGENSHEARRPLELTGAASLIERGNIVGFAEDMGSINENMKTKEEYRVVIAICGMAGSGKTTLAKLIYESSAMVEHFDIRAWCTVGQTYQLRLVLLQILGDTRESDDRFVQRNDTELLQLLHQRLIGRRYLVVLDDVWSLDIWDRLRRALPDDRNNSKVLVTTRHRALPHQMVGNCYVHEMRPLSTEESRVLFMRTAFPDGGPDMKDIKAKERMGTDMVKRCGGLPSAVVTLANLLARKSLISEWKMVHSNIDSYLTADSGSGEFSSITEVLSRSYYNLPHHLRPLFLYLGHFPEDSEIEAEKLYLLWMAEGIIPLEHGGKTVMEMTSSSLDDLVDRSIVLGQAEEGPTIRKFKSYSLHYLMRNMCLFKAKAESFFEVLDLRHSNLLNNDSFFTSSTRKIHRLAMYLDQYEDVFDDDLKPTIAQVKETAHHLRSLLLFNTSPHEQYMLWPEELFSLKDFRFLRVLDFVGFSFQTGTLPKGIENLVHLRYLSLKGCYLKELQSCIGNMLNLQTLDLRVATSCKMIIPNILWKLERLKHLYLPFAFQAKEDDKLHFAGLRELQILKNFDPRECHAQDLLELTNIQILEATTSGNNEALETIIELIKKTSLREIILDVRNFDCYSEKRQTIVTELLRCSSLHSLHIGGHIGKLPQIISSGLTELSFSGSELLEDPMPTLEKLPELRVLVLIDGAYVGEDMVCSRSGFPELRQLQISGLHKLRRLKIEEAAMGKLTYFTIERCKSLWSLTIEEAAMPKLTYLTFERCKSLEAPLSLVDLICLKEVKISSMPKEFEDGLREVQKERDEYGDDLSIRIFDNNHEEQSAAWIV